MLCVWCTLSLVMHAFVSIVDHFGRCDMSLDHSILNYEPYLLMLCEIAWILGYVQDFLYHICSITCTVNKKVGYVVN